MYDKRSKRKMGVETTRRNDRQYAFDRLLEMKSENLKQKIVLDDKEELLKDANKIKRKVEKFAKIVNEKEIMSEKKEDEQNFAKKINQAKIGKVYVEGSYDFLIPDLYAMCEHAFGMEVHGLLPAKCMYSRRWVEKGSKVISTQRSPLVAPAENQIMNVYCDDKCKEWFKYIKWGNIYSIWDLTIISQSDK